MKAPVAFFQTDLDLRYTWIYNPILDLQPEQYIGKRDDEIFPPEDAAVLMAIKQAAFDYQLPVRREVVMSGKGQPKVLFVSAQPMLDKNHAMIGVLGIYHDLSEERNLENRVSEKAFQLELNRRLMAHTDLEQQHIGKAIQEGAIQDLSGLAFSIQLARQLFPSPEALQVLAEINDNVKNLVTELREVSNALRPPGLARFGLERAIQSYLQDFQKKNPGMQIALSISGNVASLPEQINQAIYFVLKESLRNIASHSQANTVQIRLKIEPYQMLLEIDDNGIGFDLPSDWMKLTHNGCFGLVHMKESIEAIQGGLYLQTAPRQGTRVYVEIPLENV